MSIPVPGPPCTLPYAGGVIQTGWREAAIAEGSYSDGPIKPDVIILDKIDGRLVDPIPDGGGTQPPAGWFLGDFCYGLTYRTIYSRSILDDFEQVQRLREILAPGSCCYTQVKFKQGYDTDSWYQFLASFPDFYDLCYNYTSHSVPACERIEGLQCCATTHGAGYDEDTDAFIGNDWSPTDRAGPTRWNCENWTVDGTWAPRQTCNLEWYGESGNCATTCDISPYACCGCGRLCLDITFALCAQKDGEFHRFETCREDLCEDTDRPCAMNHWAMTLRPDQHYPTQPGYNGKRPLAELGDHMPYAIANPCQRQKDPTPSSYVYYNPACHAHYGALQQEENGDFVLVICGNTQWEDLTSNGVPYGLTDTDANFRAQRGEIQRRDDGDHVWPVAYHPACGRTSEWGWD